MQRKEFDSLVKLLDDPDDAVFHPVKERLFSEGISIVQKLEREWALSNNPLVHKRIEQLAHDIHFNHISDEFKLWLRKDEQELLYPLLLISKFQFPDIDINHYSKRFSSVVQEIEAELTPGLTPLEQIRVFDHIMFQEHKMARTFNGYKNPENYLLSNLITSGKGNIMALTVFFIIAGQKLQIPLYGINLPDNFAVAYLDPNKNPDQFSRKDVLFYINPGNRGAVFSQVEIDEFLKRIGRKKTDSYYTPIGNQETLQLYMNNLLKSYKNIGNREKASEFASLLRILKTV